MFPNAPPGLAASVAETKSSKTMSRHRKNMVKLRASGSGQRSSSLSVGLRRFSALRFGRRAMSPIAKNKRRCSVSVLKALTLPPTGPRSSYERTLSNGAYAYCCGFERHLQKTSPRQLVRTLLLRRVHVPPTSTIHGSGERR